MCESKCDNASEPNPAKDAAELRKLEAEATKAEHDAWVAYLRAQAQRDEYERDQATDFANCVYHFTEQVGDNSVNKCVERLAQWARRYPDKPFEIVFYSPGGSVMAGFRLYDAIRKIAAEGHHITTHVSGIAASMAGILVQAGDHRTIGRNSYLHIHEVATGAIGKLSDLKQSVDLAERLTNQACELYAARSPKWTAEELAKEMRNNEWYLSSEQALEAGFVDAIV